MKYFQNTNKEIPVAAGIRIVEMPPIFRMVVRRKIYRLNFTVDMKVRRGILGASFLASFIIRMGQKLNALQNVHSRGILQHQNPSRAKAETMATLSRLTLCTNPPKDPRFSSANLPRLPLSASADL